MKKDSPRRCDGDRSAGSCLGPGQRQVSLLVTNGIVVTMDGTGRVIGGGSVAVDDATIVAVDTADAIRRQFRGRDTIDAAGQVVMPGLVNTHTHAPMVLYRGLADDLALMDWLNNYIFPAEAKTVSPEFVRAGTRLAALEMIESGTTTFADMYYFEEEIAKETKAAGLRGVLGERSSSSRLPMQKNRPTRSPAPRRSSRPSGTTRDSPQCAACDLHERRSDAQSGAGSLQEIQRATLIHVAETRAEADTAKERGSPSVVAYLDSLGFLGPGVVAAHAVWVNAADIAILKSRGAGVSHNPESNMKLASGVAPVPAYLAADVAIGLGTDGAASNNDLDMFEAMRVASLLQKVTSNNPTAVSAKAALQMATIGGARALGRAPNSSPSGAKRADVIIRA